MKKILLVIPNYNGFSLISKNIPTIVNIFQKHKDVEIVIVDDASRKEEIANLESFLAQNTFSIPVSLIKHTMNQGFSSAVDTGAFSREADYIFFLNSDAVPEDDFLDILLAHFEKNPNLFAVGCMDKSIEPEGVVLRGRGIASWKRGMLIHARGDVNQGSDTFWVSGGSSIVDSKKFKKIDGFDRIFNPFYWEDIDLSYRAQKAGFEIIFEKKCIVEHRHEEGAIKKHYKKKKINTIAYRNQFIFLWKDITDISLAISHILWLPYHCTKAILRMDTAFFKGFFLAVLKFPDIIEKKDKQKKYFLLSDKKIIFKIS